MGAQKRLGPVQSPVVSRILEFFKGVLGRHAFFVFSCLTVFQASSGTNTYVPIRFLFSSGRWEATDQHPLQSLSARVNTGEHSEFCFFEFVQFRVFLFDDLLRTVKLQSSALLVCGFLWVLSAHLRCDSHHSRQRTVFVSVARTNTLSSVPCWAVLNPSSGGTHVTPLAPQQKKK